MALSENEFDTPAVERMDIIRGLGLWLMGSLAPGLSLSGFQALLPQECPGDCAAAACISQQIAFWMERNSRHSPGSGWPGRGWQLFFFGYSRGDEL